MIDPSSRLLVSRLSWPSGQVRLEAASQIAALILAGDAAMKTAFLDWIATRRLENEAATGVSIVEAFGLSASISAQELDEAITVPSLLSEQLIDRTYRGVRRPPRALSHAPAGARPTPTLKSYFDRHIGQVVPPVYRSLFGRLGSGGPLMLERWFVEWCWLQEQLGEPLSSADVLRGDSARNDTINPHVRQTEVYLSAWLRTLAFAVAVKGLPSALAKDLALEAMAFSPGLASLRPAARPTWSSGWLKSLDAEGYEAVAGKLWRAAARTVAADQALIALRAVETADLGFAELTLRRALHRDQLPDAAAQASQPALSQPLGLEGTFSGLLAPAAPLDLLADPLLLTTAVHPSHWGRYQVDFHPVGIQLAHPSLFDAPAMLASNGEALTLSGQDVLLSTWTFWNADWQPRRPRQIIRLGGFATTMSKAVLTKLQRSRKARGSLRMDMVRGSRAHSYEDASVDVERRWIDLDG